MLEFDFCTAKILEVRFLSEAVRPSIAENKIMSVSDVLCVDRLESSIDPNGN